LHKERLKERKRERTRRGEGIKRRPKALDSDIIKDFILNMDLDADFGKLKPVTGGIDFA